MVEFDYLGGTINIEYNARAQADKQYVATYDYAGQHVPLPGVQEGTMGMAMMKIIRTLGADGHYPRTQGAGGYGEHYENDEHDIELGFKGVAIRMPYVPNDIDVRPNQHLSATFLYTAPWLTETGTPADGPGGGMQLPAMHFDNILNILFALGNGGEKIDRNGEKGINDALNDLYTAVDNARP